MPASSVATITPGRCLAGRLHVPGDKSIAHRYALFAALAEGRSELTNFAPGADCHSTLACLRRLGVEIVEGRERNSVRERNIVTVIGRGLGQLRASGAPLDAGNSGTTMRLLTGILAGHPFVSRLIGDASLSRRPMRRVIEPIEGMGARVDSTDGHAPLTVHGACLQGMAHATQVPSAQVKSAILLAGLHAQGVTSVTEPAATRDHTERALAAFGGIARIDGPTVSVVGGQRLTGQALDVPGDFSSAAFWFVAAAALPGSSVEIEDVGLNPTRTGLLDVLRRFGASVTVEGVSEVAGEPRGLVRVEYGRAGAVEISPAEVPGLIDELPAIAALGAHGGGVVVGGAAELRVKESDRIAALVAGFRALGIAADERPDGFVIGGDPLIRNRPGGGGADARGDHRLAMAFAIAALGASRPSTIDGADVVAVSYPGFFETLERLVT